jgi:hypothetical protein
LEWKVVSLSHTFLRLHSFLSFDSPPYVHHRNKRRETRALEGHCYKTGTIPCGKFQSGLTQSDQSPGANPTIVSYNASAVKIYNASAVKIYNATCSLVRFENKNIFICLAEAL